MHATVADHIASFLEDRGVAQVFGLCGHTNISVLAAIERRGAPRFITTRHEQVAAHAADGYARATGRPGVVLVTSGVTQFARAYWGPYSVSKAFLPSSCLRTAIYCRSSPAPCRSRCCVSS